MRQVLSISLPATTVQTIKTKTKKRGFGNVSNYLKYLVDLDEEDDLISAEELMQDIKESEKEYEQGKSIQAKSLAEFL